MGHHEYRPLADMLVEMGERYGKPMMLSETGAEGTGKPSWLHYVSNEVREAMRRGADIRGICWYPITAYPGWDNSRHAETGLFSTIVADGSATSTSGCSPSSRPSESSSRRWSRRKDAIVGGQLGARCGSCDGVPTQGHPSCHSMRSISRIRRLLISSSCAGAGARRRSRDRRSSNRRPRRSRCNCDPARASGRS